MGGLLNYIQWKKMTHTHTRTPASAEILRGYIMWIQCQRISSLFYNYSNHFTVFFWFSFVFVAWAVRWVWMLFINVMGVCVWALRKFQWISKHCVQKRSVLPYLITSKYTRNANVLWTHTKACKFITKNEVFTCVFFLLLLCFDFVFVFTSILFHLNKMGYWLSGIVVVCLSRVGFLHIYDWSSD